MGVMISNYISHKVNLDVMNEYVYSPVKAAHIHRDIKVYKIDRGQNYTK